jgi:hypothetical protein
MFVKDTDEFVMTFTWTWIHFTGTTKKNYFRGKTAFDDDSLPVVASPPLELPQKIKVDMIYQLARLQGEWYADTVEADVNICPRPTHPKAGQVV